MLIHLHIPSALILFKCLYIVSPLAVETVTVSNFIKLSLSTPSKCYEQKHVHFINLYLNESFKLIVIFLTPMDYNSPWFKREVLPNFNSETGKVTPTKIGVHAQDINPYLHEFFQPIPIDQIFR